MLTQDQIIEHLEHERLYGNVWDEDHEPSACAIADLALDMVGTVSTADQIDQKLRELYC